MPRFFSRVFLAMALAGAISFPCRAHALTLPINLNDFFHDPTVTVTPTGTLATLAEDPILGVVLLANDPGLGDPTVILPGTGVILRFDYHFTEDPGANDEFGAFLVDAGTGGSLGTPFAFFTQAAGGGTIAFDLSSLVGQTLGLQFQLTSLLGDTGRTSTVEVSHVVLDSPATAVPEPATWLLLGLGLTLLTARPYWQWSTRKLRGM